MQLSSQARKQRLIYYATVVVGMFLLMMPAFYNGYPLVNPDAGTYIASGFKLETPADRPITYGILIRLLSVNGFSLWPVIFCQSYITAWLIVSVTKEILRKKYIVPAIVSLVILSLFTGLSWIASQLQPDIFTPIALLCVVLFFFGQYSKADKILLHLLFFISISAHLSHLLLFSLLLLCFYVFSVWLPTFRAITKKQILLLFVLTLATIGITGAALSKSKHIFFMGAMSQQGILKQYLDDKCPTHNYKLCAYKDSLPATADGFIWDSNSPVYKLGGWKETKPEFTEIINGTLTEPKYIALHIKASLLATAQQLLTFNIGEGNFKFPSGTNVYQRISENLPNELQAFSSDRQNTTDIISIFESYLPLQHVIMLLATFGVILLTATKWKQTDNKLRILIIVSITSIILNAWDCGTFSEVTGRYGTKIMWLLPFCALLGLYEVIRKKRLY